MHKIGPAAMENAALVPGAAAMGTAVGAAGTAVIAGIAAGCGGAASASAQGRGEQRIRKIMFKTRV